MNINRSWKTGLIAAPPRQSFVGSIIILLVTGWASLAFVLPEIHGLFVVSTLSLFLMAAIICKSIFAIHVSLIFQLLFFTANLGALFRLWPLSILAPLALYTSIVFMVPVLRKSIHWFRKGRFDPGVMALIVATITVSAIALVGWVVIVKPDIEQHITLVPKLPFWAYPLAGVCFAFTNAAMEEVVFRGIAMEALDSAVGAGYRSVFMQAVPFAAFHYLAGFPNGFWGFLLVLVYGIMLGGIRRISQGIIAPLVAHVGADLTIFLIVLIYYI